MSTPRRDTGGCPRHRRLWHPLSEQVQAQTEAGEKHGPPGRGLPRAAGPKDDRHGERYRNKLSTRLLRPEDSPLVHFQLLIKFSGPSHIFYEIINDFITNSFTP